MQTQTLDAFQVIADPSRRQMMQLLSKDSMTINALAENFDMKRPAGSYQSFQPRHLSSCCLLKAVASFACGLGRQLPERRQAFVFALEEEFNSSVISFR